MFYRRNKKGFTLIELICVIAMMAVLGSIVGMSVNAVIRSNREKSCLNELDSYFTISQNVVQAINNGRGKRKLSEYTTWVTESINDSSYKNKLIEAEFQSKISPDAYAYLHFYFQDSRAPLADAEEGLYLRIETISDNKFIRIAKMYLIKDGVRYHMLYNDNDKTWKSAKV